MQKSKQILTSCLRLRKFSAGDIPFVFSASRYPGFCDGMKWSPPDSEKDLIQPLEQNEAAWKAGEAFTFTIELKADNTPVGRIVIRSAGGAVWDIGFWTHPEHQGRGYMTEAAHAILALGFEELAAERIDAAHATWNKASQRVLQKIGMRFVKHTSRGFEKNGEWVPEDLYSIEAANWKT